MHTDPKKRQTALTSWLMPNLSWSTRSLILASRSSLLFVSLILISKTYSSCWHCLTSRLVEVNCSFMFISMSATIVRTLFSISNCFFWSSKCSKKKGIVKIKQRKISTRAEGNRSVFLALTFIVKIQKCKKDKMKM